MADAPATRYGVVFRTLHWLTVAALAAQFVLGYLVGESESGGGGRGRGRGRGGDSGRGRGRGGDDAASGGESEFDGLGLGDGVDLIDVHVGLGLAILALGIARLVWRRAGGLPPWSDALSRQARRVATGIERTLLGSLLIMPVTGLVLVFSGDDDLLWLHIASHGVLYAALAAHLALVVRYTVVVKAGILRRML